MPVDTTPAQVFGPDLETVNLVIPAEDTGLAIADIPAGFGLAIPAEEHQH